MGKFGVGHFQPLLDPYRKWLLNISETSVKQWFKVSVKHQLVSV